MTVEFYRSASPANEGNPGTSPHVALRSCETKSDWRPEKIAAHSVSFCWLAMRPCGFAECGSPYCARITVLRQKRSFNRRARPSGRANPRLVLERDDLALVGTGAHDANRRTIERRKEGRVRHVRAYFVEERFEAEINPGRRRRIVVRWQEKLWFEQLDERPRITDLRVGDRVDLIGRQWRHRRRAYRRACASPA